jgi:hypothetical protein
MKSLADWIAADATAPHNLSPAKLVAVNSYRTSHGLPPLADETSEIARLFAEYAMHFVAGLGVPIANLPDRCETFCALRRELEYVGSVDQKPLIHAVRNIIRADGRINEMARSLLCEAVPLIAKTIAAVGKSH